MKVNPYQSTNNTHAGKYRRVRDRQEETAKAAAETGEDKAIIHGDESVLADTIEEEREVAASETDEEVLFPGREELPEAVEAGKTGASANLEDNSRSLTRRLVAAKMQIQVMDVRSKAMKDIADLMMAAAMSQDREAADQARAIIKRLRKVVNRSQRKINDLNKEDNLELRKQRAEKQKKAELERQIERELKKRKTERKNREEKYLREQEQQEIKPMGQGQLTASEQAQIEAQAVMMAAMEMSAPGGGESIDVSVSGAGEVSGSEVSADTAGAEGAVADAGV